MTWSCWTGDDTERLLALLRLDTVTPMETGRLSDLPCAQNLYAAWAGEIGMEVASCESAPPAVLDDAAVPVSVLEWARELGRAFLEAQPNLVLRLGKAARARTLVFNFHMDTVAGEVEVGCEAGRVSGRGVADAKGLGLAVLTGIRHALSTQPDLPERISIVIQSVAGEEGGAMGFYGTRYLVHQGWWGRLNIVSEPTSFRWLDRTTASMTACIRVAGVGSTDDAPDAGQNATILLGAVAATLAHDLAPRVFDAGGKLCIAGVHTGTQHNRVYGVGQLLLNLAYPSLDVGLALESLVEQGLDAALDRFRREFAGSVVARASACAARDICSLNWLKRRLPVLANRDAELEGLLRRAGLERHEESSGVAAFTCDAMWFEGRGYTVVIGPGDLVANRAHAPGEYLELDDLDRFAAQVSSLVRTFGNQP